jgi:aminopeptidase N
LFHQWFGDYVTTESWSNLTLNESFATLGSQLWNEFKYGRDAGDEERYNSAQGYLGSKSDAKDLVRFHYNDKEDMFDAVSYNKGGAILQMLRNYVGDSAFFKSLNLYLTTNKFKSAEAHQLRLAFEEVTGKDLNWFWNQWYFSNGHPVLDVTNTYDNAGKQVTVTVRQSGEHIFRLPVKIDVFSGGSTTRYDVWVDGPVSTFKFPAASKPELVNFDADKKLLADLTEHKSLEEYLFQYRHAGNYVDRREAIDAALAASEQVTAITLLGEATKDSYGPLRAYVFNSLDMSVGQVKTGLSGAINDAARRETFRPAKSAAIGKLGFYKNQSDAQLFLSALNDSSYSVAGSALEALNRIDTTIAFREANRLGAMPSKGKLATVISNIKGSRDVNASIKLLKDFEDMPLGQSKFNALNGVFNLLSSTSNFDLFKRGVDDVIALEAQIPEAFREQAITQLNAAFRELQKDKLSNGLKDQSDYLLSKLPKDGKM